jgi:hypothetical protein
MLIARLALAALATLAVTSPAFAADPAWTEISTKDFSAWREAEHPGWTRVSDAVLRGGAGNRLDGKPGEGVLLSRGDSNLYTQEEFQDLELKLEFMIPAGSNSGVKFNGHYEIQILDSHDRPEAELTGNDCGGVYPRADAKYQHIDKGSPPSENAALPPGQWQTLEIVFRGPRFDDAGKKTESARFVEVKLNGKTVQKDVEVKYATGHAWDDVAEVARGPLMLQGDHGPVAFRNIQIRALSPPRP